MRKRAIELGYPGSTKWPASKQKVSDWTDFIKDNQQTQQSKQQFNRVIKQIKTNNEAKVIVDFKSLGERQSKKHGLSVQQFSLSLSSLITQENFAKLAAKFERDLAKAISKVIRQSGLRTDDKINIELVDVANDIHANTGMLFVNDMSASVLLDRIRRSVLNSAKKVEGGATITITAYKQPRGGSKNRPGCYEDARKLGSVIQVNGSVMNDCFFQCIAIALARMTKDKDPSTYNRLTSNKYVKESYRIRAAKELYDKAGREYNAENNQIALSEIPMIEEKLQVSINVYGWQEQAFIYETRKVKMVNIYLLYRDNHYDLVTSMGRILGTTKFCAECNKGYNSKHSCATSKLCRACSSSVCEGVGKEYAKSNIVQCSECAFWFFGDECFARHKESKCATSHKCTKCKTIFDPRKVEHKCGFNQCKNCNRYVGDNHKCFHVKKPFKTPNDKLLAFDLECDPNNVHEVLCAVMTYIYHDINDFELPHGAELIDGCFVFKDFRDFCKYLFSPIHKGYKAYAHYGGRYDFQFLRSYMADEAIGIKKQTVNGCKFMRLDTFARNGVALLDSYNIIPIRLESFPKTFGLKGMKKGYFPYTFATMENRFQVFDKYPNLRHFKPSGKKQQDEYNKLLEWYVKNSNKRYDVWKEMVEYCVSDVVILAKGIRKFRDMLLDMTDQKFDITEYTTIAGASQAVYSAMFMPENTIAVIEDDLKLNQSRKEIKWLHQLETTHGIVIERQKKIGDYYVDGFCAATNTVYEFHGCYWHGCPTCYGAQMVNKVNKKTMSDLFAQTEKKRMLLEADHNYVCIWEHDFDESKVNIEEKELPATLRDAFFGGNTQSFKPYVEADGKSKRIRYFDFTSLYPSVNYGRYRPVHKDKYNKTFRRRYPIGHPERMNPVNVEGDLSNVMGVVKCKVIPAKMYSPILPQKRDGKLMFHCEPFVGCFFSEELKFAVQHGYKIEEIYDVINFPMTFEKPEVAEALFEGYVKMFVKIKLEADGKPKDMSLSEYIQQVAAMDGILLDASKMEERNEGLRFIAKLFLNSLWGKYGQNLERDELKTFTDPAAFHKFMVSEDNDIKKIQLVNENCVDVVFAPKKHSIQPPYKVNLPIALATTAYARMRLQEVMQIVGDDLIYCDTDSVIFTDDVNSPYPIATSFLLGDLKDELEGDYITEFIATGPKSYSYVTAGGTQVTKIKGFALDIDTQSSLNHYTLKEIVQNHGSGTIATQNMQFVINKHERTITTKNSAKQFQMVADKRNIDWASFESYPFGFKENCL